jgi:Zn-dependent protease/Tfp pilus assembly protein PilF
MNNLTAGSFPLFRVAGIQVYLHWSWLVIGYFEVGNRVNTYESSTWNVLEYLALFGIVLLHEFGHALACRQVGGQADRIVLWPLGGVAFVQPPPRPGALLWSIAAGPLVNLILVPVSVGAVVFARVTPLGAEFPDLLHFLISIGVINFVLLVFNLLPIYPLDGGQILRALLWFVIGPGRSLMVTGVVGLAGAAGMIVLAVVFLQDKWLAFLALFVAWQAWRGFRSGVALQGLQSTVDLFNEGLTAARAGRHDDAVELYTKVIDASGNPGVVATTLTNRAIAEGRRANWQRAIEDYREAIRLQPDQNSAVNNLAWLLATCPVEALRDGPEAVEHATRACHATGWRNSSCLATLAAAWAEAGDFGRAVHWHTRALADPAFERTFGEAAAAGRLRLYEQGVPHRLPASGG